VPAKLRTWYARAPSSDIPKLDFPAQFEVKNVKTGTSTVSTDLIIESEMINHDAMDPATASWRW
jgi:hypothetical protein